MIEQIINSFSSNDIINFMKIVFDADILFENNERLVFSTEVCHGGDSHNLVYFKSNHLFFCRTHCNNIGSLLDLVMKNKNCNESAATDIILEFVNLRREGYEFDFDSSIENVEKQTVDDIEIEFLPTIDKPFLHRIFSNRTIKCWESEFVTKETMQKYEIRYDIERNQIIIPHFCWNSRHRVVGIRVRNLDSKVSEKYGKYIPLTYHGISYNHALSKNLYGFNFNKKFIKKKKKVIIFEGEKSVLQMDSFYRDKNLAVAVCGSALNIFQKKILIDNGVKDITIAFDKQFQKTGDEEYYIWKEKIKKITMDLRGIVDVYVIWDTNNILDYKDSPSDKGKKIFEQLYKERIRLEDFYEQEL